MTMMMTMTITMAMTMTITMIVIMIGCWSFTSPLDQSASKGFPSHQGMCTSSATSLTQCPNLTHTECPSHTVSQPLTGGGKSTIRYQHHQNFYLNELQCSEFLVHSKRMQIKQQDADRRCRVPSRGCHRHCRMKTGSCKTCHIQLNCEQ